MRFSSLGPFFSFVPLSFTAMKHLDMGSLSFLAAVAMPIMEATSKVNRRTQKVNNGWHCFWSSVETPWTLYSCSGSQRMQSVREGSFFFLSSYAVVCACSSMRCFAMKHISVSQSCLRMGRGCKTVATVTQQL